MIQTVQKWRIVIYLSEPEKPVMFLIWDDCPSEMLKKLAMIDFEYHPRRIEITRE